MAGSARRRVILELVLGMMAVTVMFAANVYAAQSAGQSPAPTSAVPTPVQSADEAYRTGKQFEGKQDYVAAMRWYRKAADQGNALAQVAVGNLYGMAQGVAQDYGEALRWYRKAADQGNNEAEDNVGFFYLSGWGVTQDYAEALRWFRKAADHANEVAERNIGMIYLQGLGVAQDRTEAIRWFRKAAAHGDAESKDALKQFDAR